MILLLFSCSETVKTGCDSDNDCEGDRICDLSLNSCVTCKATMCEYENAKGICKANEIGKIACGLGDCDLGFWNLDNNESNGCEYSCEFISEKDDNCDGVDDNCNGEFDEDVNTALPESCGGCGNNCLDLVNSHIESLTVTCEQDSGNCIYTCKDNYHDLNSDYENGCEYSCVVSNNGIEICDSADNNCDGNADEDLECSCNEGDVQNCTVANTHCEGEQNCSSGNWETCSSSDSTVGLEICDGIDNDCFNGIDDIFKTGEIYTDNNNCGACGNVCEEVHGTNTCKSNGTCNPVCSLGWSNFDENGLNGCETGCDAYLGFNNTNNKSVATSTVNAYVDEADAFYKDGKILLSYTEKDEFITNVVAKIIDKNGVEIVPKKYLTQHLQEEHSVLPSITMTDNYSYILYKDDYANSQKINLLVKDQNLNLGDQLLVSPSGENPSISKENFIDNKVFMTWRIILPKIGGGFAYNIGINSYNEVSAEMENIHSITGSSYVLSSPKITTGKPLVGRGFIAVAYCEERGSSVSNLYLRFYDTSYDNEKSVSIESFTDGTCNNFAETGSLTSSGESVYIAYTKDYNFNMKKYKYGPDILNNGVYKVTLSKAITVTGTSKNYIKNATINYSNNNLLLVSTNYFYQTLSSGLGIMSFSKAYSRYTFDLLLKDSKSIVSEIGTALSTNNDSILYSDDNEIIILYEKGFNDTKNINITRTYSCEN
jgi:hypothetical protein